MTRKHYRTLARLIGEHGIYINSGFINDLIFELKKDNNRFNINIFRAAIHDNIKPEIKEKGFVWVYPRPENIRGR